MDYYYDITALGANYAENEQDFHWVVCHEFEHHGIAGASYQTNFCQTEEDLLQHRTDGTDAFDTLYIGCEKFPHREIMPYTSSGVL